MVVGARRADLSISETADLLGFKHNCQRIVRKRENIHWAAVLRVKMPCWCQRSEEDGLTGSSW